MARLAASHRRRAADRGKLYAARMGKASRPQPDRYARRISSIRLDAGQAPPSPGDRRLPALDAGKISAIIRGATKSRIRNPATANDLRVAWPHLSACQHDVETRKARGAFEM